MKFQTVRYRDILALLSLALVIGCGGSSADLHGNLLPPGTPLPPLAAEGWLNGPGPTVEELRGQVVVIDVWAFWCPPCRAAMPEMVAAYEKYHDRGVTFLGLTSEGTDTLSETRGVVDSATLSWPNGYGAGATIQSLGVQAIPSVFVIGRDGRVVWNIDRPGSMQDAIESALDKS
ncbi:MAG TPA: TlpA disulfide reductase family protein [Pirellulales bacterium]|jgi:thiol-disulfide isomerase/thioredoxin